MIFFFFLNAFTLCMCCFMQQWEKWDACWVLTGRVATVSNMEQDTSGTPHSNLAGQLLCSTSQLLPRGKMGLRIKLYVRFHIFSNHSHFEIIWHAEQNLPEGQIGPVDWILWPLELNPGNNLVNNWILSAVILGKSLQWQGMNTQS